MFFVFEDKRYPFVGLDMSVRDIMALQIQLVDADFTTIRSYDDLARIGEELRALPEDEREAHPEFYFWTAMVLWAAMRAQGEKVTVDYLLDSSLTTLETHLEPSDVKAGEGAGKAQSRPSGSGGGNRAERRSKKAHR